MPETPKDKEVPRKSIRPNTPRGGLQMTRWCDLSERVVGIDQVDDREMRGEMPEDEDKGLR